jgi:hypothetical protein
MAARNAPLPSVLVDQLLPSADGTLALDLRAVIDSAADACDRRFVSTA